MESDAAVLRLEAIGTEGERDYRPECESLDLDQLLRNMFAQWLRLTGRSPEDLATSLRIEIKEVRAFLRGRPGTLDMLSRVCASSGLSVAEVFALSQQYRDYTGQKVVSFKKALLNRLESMMTEAEVKTTFHWHSLCADLPEFNACMIAGMRMAFDLAEKQGVRVPEVSRALLDEVWEHRVELRTVGSD